MSVVEECLEKPSIHSVLIAQFRLPPQAETLSS